MKNMLIALLLASSLSGCNSKAPHPDPPSGAVKAPNYWTKFEGLGCCIVIDSLRTNPKALQPGVGGAGETAAWIPTSDALRMELKAPNPVQPVPSMGIFKTGQNFGPGTHFSVSATFRKPQGRMDPPAPWTVTVVARTGGAPDPSDLGRLLLTLRVRNGVHLRIQEGPNGPTTVPIPGAAVFDFVPTDIAYQEIYLQQKPFTLRLEVNRKSGKGVATLTTASQEFPIPFEMDLFKKDSGPPLTTVGTAIANNIPGETVSVEVTDLMVAKH